MENQEMPGMQSSMFVEEAAKAEPETEAKQEPEGKVNALPMDGPPEPVQKEPEEATPEAGTAAEGAPAAMEGMLPMEGLRAPPAPEAPESAADGDAAEAQEAPQSESESAPEKQEEAAAGGMMLTDAPDAQANASAESEAEPEAADTPQAESEPAPEKQEEAAADGMMSMDAPDASADAAAESEPKSEAASAPETESEPAPEKQEEAAVDGMMSMDAPAAQADAAAESEPAPLEAEPPAAAVAEESAEPVADGGSGEVFYRKWRPQQFSDVVGQEHITRTLRKAILADKVAHAYLFTGPRGVGKTSSARIVAKALNCLDRQDGEPDNRCQNCVAAEQERMIDLVEIDAASNRGIDNIRNLKEGVKFQAMEGGWKIYIIDEVHMLTEEAFNALLKTLEEPPPKVVLILATTDAHKVPQTVVSRCQRYDFHRISEEVLMKRLARLCEEEGIECPPAVLGMIAGAAWGSLRDAENILEQAALGASTADGEKTSITAESVAELLGLGDTAAAVRLARALLDMDAKAALQTASEELTRGISPQSIRKGVLEALRGALLLTTGVRSEGAAPPELAELAKTVKDEGAQRQLLRALERMDAVKFADAQLASMPLELAVYSLCLPPPEPVAAATPEPAAASAGAAPRPAAPQRPPAPARNQQAAARPAARGSAPSSSPEAEKHRQQLSDALRRHQRSILATLMLNVEFSDPKDGVLQLRFMGNTIYEKFASETKEPGAQKDFRAAVDEVYGEGLKLQVLRPSDGEKQSGAESAAESEESPTVRVAMQVGAVPKQAEAS